MLSHRQRGVLYQREQALQRGHLQTNLARRQGFEQQWEELGGVCVCVCVCMHEPILMSKSLRNVSQLKIQKSNSETVLNRIRYSG